MSRASLKRYFARSEGASADQLALERAAGRVDSEADVLLACERHLEERLLRGRRDRLEPFGRPRLDLVAADVEPVALADLDDVARLRRRRVLPLERRRKARCSLLDLGHQSIVK